MDRHEYKSKNCFDGCKKHLKQYAESSTISAFGHLSQDLSWRDRLWWTIVFSLCVTGCAIMIYQIIDKWITDPVIVTLASKEEQIYDIPFPAVTICPQSKINTKCLNYTKILLARMSNNLENTTYRENKLYDYMAALCHAQNHDAKKLLSNRSIWTMFKEKPNGIVDDKYPDDFVMHDYSDFLYDCAAVTFDNMICKWMGIKRPCQKLMTPIITDQGLCYSFNMLDVRDIYSSINQMKYFQRGRKPNWDVDWGYPKYIMDSVYPRRSFHSGAENSFSVVVFTNREYVEYACNEFSIQGIRVSLHMPAKVPRPSQVFFAVGLNRLATAAVLPSNTLVSKNIKRYEAKKRNCYFSTERNLKYFKIYTQGNCNFECWTNFTIKTCQCVGFYMPRDNRTRICSLKERYCLEEARKQYPQTVLKEILQTDGTTNAQGCDCLPLCTDLTYNYQIAASDWSFDDPDDAAFDNQRFTAEKYYGSAVKIFFKNNYFLPYYKDELYGTIDLISDCGSLLGLFIGFTLVSFTEIVYFFSIKIIGNYRRYGRWVAPDQ